MADRSPSRRASRRGVSITAGINGDICNRPVIFPHNISTTTPLRAIHRGGSSHCGRYNPQIWSFHIMSSSIFARSSGVSRRARQLWSRYGVFWLGAIAVGFVAVLYARLIDWGYDAFRAMEHRHVWLPLIVTPAVGAACVWLTRRFFRGAEGS